MNKILLFALVIFISSNDLLAQNFKMASYREDRLDINLETFLVVDVSEQLLYVLKENVIDSTFPISTSKYGIGNQIGSNKTPPGLHRIKRKIGSKVPLGGILRGRHFTGKKAKIYTDSTDVNEDLVLTRVLWLEGLEEGRNRGTGIDTFRRCIYIHGTNEEGLIGKPSSHGCIRMKNTDVITLFNLVSEGIFVFIKD